MIKSILVSAAIVLAAGTVALQPSVDISHGALIVNTKISSAILDHQGVAISIIPSGLSCGLDSTAWCEVANWTLA